MNLVEKLLAVDKKAFDEIEKKEMPSRQLEKLIGVEGAKLTIQAIDGDLYTSLSATAMKKKGVFDYGKGFDVNAKIAAAGIIEPDLKNEELLKHLGVATPAEAAKKIFKGEVNAISDEVAKISGFYSEDETEEEIKN
ncbi:MAG: hypothetical protein K1W24_06640 [Lachnospiraceae bacterium]